MSSIKLLWKILVVFIIGFNFLMFPVSLDKCFYSKCTTKDMRQAMEIATKFRREGDMSLDIYLKEAIKPDFSNSDLALFNKLKDAAERRALINSFKNDTFQYMDKDGISHTYPKGYIDRTQN